MCVREREHSFMWGWPQKNNRMAIKKDLCVKEQIMKQRPGSVGRVE